MLFEKFQLINLPFEQFVAGGILRQLMLEVGPHNSKSSFPDKAPEDEVLDHAVNKGIQEGLSALTKQIHTETSLIQKVVENNFQLPVREVLNK